MARQRTSEHGNRAARLGEGRGRGFASLGAGLGLAAGIALSGAVACGPVGISGHCDEDMPCEGRGQVCDLETFECVTQEIDTSSAESPAPASFMNKIVAFHRGELCVPHEVQSGSPIPVLMRPCLHPCVETSSYEFRHLFECTGSRCEAVALMWVNASSAMGGCPADAFSSFDRAQCQYGTEIEFTISSETSDGPISGTMQLEVPYLTNADMAEIAADPGDTDRTRELIEQYPSQTNRIPDGRNISLLPGNPVPPASCAGGACPCYPIGF